MKWMRTTCRLLCLMSFFTLVSCGNDDTPGGDGTGGGGTVTPTEPTTENELKQLLTKTWEFGEQSPYENLRLFDDMTYSLLKRPEVKADDEPVYITGTYEIGSDLKTVKLNGFGTMKLTSVDETDLSFTLTPDGGDPVDLTCTADDKQVVKPVIFQGKRVAAITVDGALAFEMTYSGGQLVGYREYGAGNVPDSTGTNPEIPRDSTGIDVPRDSLDRLASVSFPAGKADSTGVEIPANVILDVTIAHTAAEVKMTGIDSEKGPFVSTYILNEKGLAVSSKTLYEQGGRYESAEFTYTADDYLSGWIARENGAVSGIAVFTYNGGDLARLVYTDYDQGASFDYTYVYAASDMPNKGGVLCPDIEVAGPFAPAYYAGILGRPAGHLVSRVTDIDGNLTGYDYALDDDGYIRTSVMTETYVQEGDSRYSETYGYTFR